MRPLFYLFFVFVVFQLNGQETKYLDVEFGNNGIVSIDDFRFPYFADTSNDGSCFINVKCYDHESTAFTYNCILSLNADGSRNESFGNGGLQSFQNSEDLFWFWDDHKWQTHQQENIVILEKSAINQSKLITYNIELEQEFIFLPSLVNDGEVIISNADNLIWYNTDGSLKSTFGNGGTLDLNTIIPNMDSFIFYLFRQRNTIDHLMVICKSGEKEYLAKVRSDGILDTSFGTNGLLTSEDFNIVALSVSDYFNSGYLIYSEQSGYEKINSQGVFDEDFTKFKLHEQLQSDNSNIINYHGQFSSKYSLWSQTFIIQENDVYYSNDVAFLVDDIGNFIEDFGEEGLINLNVPFEVIQDVFITEDDEVFISSIQRDTTSNNWGSSYIKKLDPNLFNNYWDINMVHSEPFTLFPNPVLDNLSIQYNGAKAIDIRVTTYDAIGRLLDVQYLDELYFQEKVNLPNFDQYSSGVYYFSINSEDGKLTHNQSIIKI